MHELLQTNATNMVPNREPREITLLIKAWNALEEATTVEELSKVHDLAESVRGYYKKLELGRDLAVSAAVVKLKAMKKLGLLLAETPIAKGGAGNQHRSAENVNQSQHGNGSPKTYTLAELGIRPALSSRCQQIARIPEKLFDAYVEKAVVEAREPSTAGALRIARQHFAVERTKKLPRVSGFVTDLNQLMEGGKKFPVLYIDPPWDYRNKSGNGACANSYPSMTNQQLLALPVPELVTKSAHCHLWATSSFLPFAFELLERWGFSYRSNFVWVKPDIGVGNYWRMSHEHLLWATRGDEDTSHEILLLGTKQGEPFQTHDLRSWGEFPRQGHSVKPPEIRRLIESASPGPYLELFGRSPVKGWTVFGNQVIS